MQIFIANLVKKKRTSKANPHSTKRKAPTKSLPDESKSEFLVANNPIIAPSVTQKVITASSVAKKDTVAHAIASDLTVARPSLHYSPTHVLQKKQSAPNKLSSAPTENSGSKENIRGCGEYCSHPHNTRPVKDQIASLNSPKKDHHLDTNYSNNKNYQPINNHIPNSTTPQSTESPTPNKAIDTHYDHSSHPVNNKLSLATTPQVKQTTPPNKASDTHHDHTNCGHNHSSQPVNDQLSSPITPQLSPTPTSNIASDHQHDANCDHHHSSQLENTIKENIFDSKNETYIFTDQEISTYRINLAEFLYSADSEINENLVSTPFFKAGLSKAFYAQTVGIFARA